MRDILSASDVRANGTRASKSRNTPVTRAASSCSRPHARSSGRSPDVFAVAPNDAPVRSLISLSLSLSHPSTTATSVHEARRSEKFFSLPYFLFAKKNTCALSRRAFSRKRAALSERDSSGALSTHCDVSLSPSLSHTLTKHACNQNENEKQHM